MALVAYDYDSTSDVEEDGENSVTSTVTINPKPNSTQNNGNSTEEQTNEVSSTSSLFSSLPESKTKVGSEIQEDKIEDFIPKSKAIPKVKEKVKITIPSLSSFKSIDDDEPQTKKVKLASKTSGLISLLPPVKGTVLTSTSFVPKSVVNRNRPTTSTTKKTNSLIPNAIRKKAEAQKNTMMKKLMSKATGSDVESDDDFEIPESFDDAMWEKVCGRPKPKKIPIKPAVIPPPVEEVNIAPEPEQPYEGLDNTAFKQLVGKTKRPIGNIKLIDVNEEEILQEKDLWMAKSLTDPEFVPKTDVEDPVDPTRRKRHHITYLAQQAKANEQELQSQWASSKNNRMATRAKYGF